MNLPFPVKVLYHTLFILHFYTHTLLSYLCSFGTICWHIRRFIFNTSNIFRIFTDSFLFINASKRHMSSPFTHLFKEESQLSWGPSFVLFCFLLAGLLFSLLSRFLTRFLLFHLLHRQRALFQLVQADLAEQLLEVGLASDFFHLPPVPLEPVDATGVRKEADQVRTRVSAGQTSFRLANRHFFPVKVARLGPTNWEIARQAV